MADLVIKGVGKHYGREPVLADVDLCVASGTMVTLLGASGSGKTTLLRLVCGFERLDEGSIEVDGRPVASRRLHLAPERRNVGYVAQEGALFPHLSVADNIRFGLPRSERRSLHVVERLLSTVGLSSAFAARFPHELSGGEQQRIALARALAPNPRVVLLDEPFSSLDAALRNETRGAVANALAEAGATALLVTHDQAEALSMGRQVAVLRRGRIAQVAEPACLYSRPVDAELAQFLGEANILPGVAKGGLVACSLGRLRAATGTVDGPVEVMIRPEQVRLVDQGATTVAAEVRDVTFYGPNTTVVLALPGSNGGLICARVAGHRTPQVGAGVHVLIDSDIVAFPAVAANSSSGSTSSNAVIELAEARKKLATAV